MAEVNVVPILVPDPTLIGSLVSVRVMPRIYPNSDELNYRETTRYMGYLELLVDGPDLIIFNVSGYQVQFEKSNNAIEIYKYER